MPLTLTASYLSQYSTPNASALTALANAADEVLTARYGGLSWLAYHPTVSPQLESGDEFVFGTVTNLYTSTAPYSATEFPSAPAGGQVVSYDSASKYVTVTGTSDFGVKALNIKYYSWKSPIETTASRWWAKYDQCERFQKLGVADIIIQNYTDPFAGNNTTFTWKSHWDKYGCIRVHNGNRFAITWTDGSGSTQVIPAYGVKCARRLTRSSSFNWANNYLHQTLENDEMTYDAEYQGQYAACMENITPLVDTFRNYCRFNSDIDSVSTLRESASFGGALPTTSSYIYDWIYHTGDILSVLTELTSGTSSIATLTWNGIAAGGFAANSRVNVSYLLSNNIMQIASAVLNPNWVHHLIPKSTNLIGIGISDITSTPITQYAASVFPWSHLQDVPRHGGINTSSYTFKVPYSPYDNTQANRTYNYDITYFLGYKYDLLKWDATIGDIFPDPALPTSITSSKSIDKCNDAIGVKLVHTINDVSGSYCAVFDDTILDNINVNASTSSLVIPTATHLSSLHTRRRFIARQKRKYHEAGELNGSTAEYDWHPQDADITGSLDADASNIGIVLKPIFESDVKIEGIDFTSYRPLDGNKTETPIFGIGTWLQLPQNYLHYVLENINTQGWWFQHYQSLLDGTHNEEWKLLTWRLPRLIEQYNDLAKAINNIREVIPATLEDLYYRPLPAGMRVKPWGFYPNEYPITIPQDWHIGHNDVDGRFATWCSQWGIPVSTIDISAIMYEPRKVWRSAVDTQTYPLYVNPLHHIYDFDKLDFTVVDPMSSAVVETVNAYTYQRKYAVWNSTMQRILFGSAGALTRYRYASYLDVAGAFNFCNINIGPKEMGYRYTPTIEDSPYLTRTIGTYYGDEDYDAGYSAIANDWYDSQILYRKPDTSGTWMETIDDRDHCKLSDMSGGDDYVIVHTQRDPTVAFSPKEFLVHTMNYSTDAKKYAVFYYRSAHGDVLSYSPNKLVPLDTGIDRQAYQSIPYFSADYPVTIIASAEPYYSHYYVDPWPSASVSMVYEGFTQTTPASVPLFIKYVSVSDYPVTTAKLNSWSGQSLDCWHIQIVKHTGILRA